MDIGDITLFARSGRIVSSGVLTYKLRSADLAAHLWHRQEDGTTWEFVYFLDEITAHDIPVERLNRIVGYKPNNVIQGFTVLDAEKSDRILNYFDLSSSVYLPPVSEAEYLRAVDDENLDVPTQGTSRREQAFLRANMFGDRANAECCICGTEFPIGFLVAAHIKKRSECSVAERKDYQNIVAPMCKFGCDDLYEKHYLYVERGFIKVNGGKPVTQAVDGRLQSLNGRPCSAWSGATRSYFEWHRHVATSKGLS